MFCEKCGTELEDGARFCKSCGARINPLEEEHRLPDIMGAEMKGWYSKAQLAVRGIGAVLLILCFLPMFSVSCQGMKVNFSVFETMVGKEVEGQMVDGNVLVAVLILIPIILIAAFCIKEGDHISSVCSSLGIISLIIYANCVKARVSQETGGMINTVQFTGVYTFSMILYIISGILSCWCILFQKKMLHK